MRTEMGQLGVGWGGGVVGVSEGGGIKAEGSQALFFYPEWKEETFWGSGQNNRSITELSKVH